MPASLEVAPQVEPYSQDETLKLREPKPVAPKRQVRSLLHEIFEGHEEFLGLTPD
jgi:hypothetical protein